MEDHEDDVFFTPGSDLIDVEGSKPAMALSFMKWISQEKDFEYLFLTEDTSFVAINKVGEKQSWNENVIWYLSIWMDSKLVCIDSPCSNFVLIYLDR